MMKRIVGVMLVGACCLAAQQLDFSSLDKLAAKAKSVNKVSLDRKQLESALSMLAGLDSGMDKDSKKNLDQLKRMTQDLTGVEVRSFEFDKPQQYRDADLTAIRNQMTQLKDWSKVIDSKEDGEHSEIFMNSTEGHKGLMIISAEETEVSVVMLKGASSLKDLGSLGAIVGLPSVAIGPAKKEE